MDRLAKNMGKHEETEVTPFLNEKNDNEASSEGGSNNEKLGNIAKGVCGAFIFALMKAISTICVQALENR